MSAVLSLNYCSLLDNVSKKVVVDLKNEGKTKWSKTRNYVRVSKSKQIRIHGFVRRRRRSDMPGTDTPEENEIAEHSDKAKAPRALVKLNADFSSQFFPVRFSELNGKKTSQ